MMENIYHPGSTYYYSTAFPSNFVRTVCMQAVAIITDFQPLLETRL